MDTIIDVMELGLLMLVPVTAIAGGICASMVKKSQQHREEMARLQANRSSGLDENSRSELNALRRELAALRDTTTQYDMSVERNMQEVLQRLQALEARNAPIRTAQASVGDPAPASSASVYSPQSEAHRTLAPEEAPLRIQAGS